jgi:hypothetical protein
MVRPDSDVGGHAAVRLDAAHQVGGVLAPAEVVPSEHRLDPLDIARDALDDVDHRVVALGTRRLAHRLDRHLAVVHPRRVFDDAVGVVPGVLHEFGRLAADLPLDGRGLGDDVRRRAALDATGVDPRRTVLVAGDRVEVPHCGRHRLDGVSPLVGLTAGVGRSAREFGAELRDGEKAVDPGDDLARGVVKTDMHGQQRVHAVEVTALGHRLPAAYRLLGGLEEHLQRPRKLGVVSDGFEHAEPERRVGVVAAGVHRARLRPEPFAGRAVVVAGRLLAGQAVDVDTEADGRSRTAVEDGHRAGVTAGHPVEEFLPGARLAGPLAPGFEFGFVGDADALLLGEGLPSDVYLVDAERFEFLDDAGGGPELPPGGFGVVVELASQRCQPVVTRGRHTRDTQSNPYTVPSKTGQELQGREKSAGQERARESFVRSVVILPVVPS